MCQKTYGTKQDKFAKFIIAKCPQRRGNKEKRKEGIRERGGGRDTLAKHEARHEHKILSAIF